MKRKTLIKNVDNDTRDNLKFQIYNDDKAFRLFGLVCL